MPLPCMAAALWHGGANIVTFSAFVPEDATYKVANLGIGDVSTILGLQPDRRILFAAIEFHTLMQEKGGKKYTN